MTRQKIKSLAAFLYLLLIFAGVANTSGNSLTRQMQKEQVYQAYISEQMEKWDPVIQNLDRRKASLSYEQLGELLNYYYGYTGWIIGEGEKKKALRYIEEAEEIIDRLQTKNPDAPQWYAYRAAFMAYRISLNKMKAAFLIKESNLNIARAIELGPDCEQGWIEKGNGMFYTPKILGGSKEEAGRAYEKAIRIMERDPESLQHNWLYLNVLMMLGQSYEKTGNTTMAKNTYEKILRIEPDFRYMRDELYPAFMKSLNKQ